MNGEERENKPVSITLPDDLVQQIDDRAKKLDLNRSQYLRQLARKDIERAKEEEKVAA